MTFDPSKPYATRGGHQVMLLPIRSHTGGYIGAWRDHDHHWHSSEWQSSGSWGGGSPYGLDLINTPEKFTRTGWVNVYGKGVDDDCGVYEAKDRADKYAMPNRIACIPITYSGIVGEGLNAGTS